MMRHGRARGWLVIVPAATGALLVVPIAAGLAGTALPAAGYLPAIGGHALSLAPWRALLSTPGFASSVRLTLQTGLAATLLSVALAIGFCAFARQLAGGRRVGAALAPLLATPHSALAIGFAFLVAPSGWLVRAALAAAGGAAAPPDVATVGDPQGVALIVALVLKETPFLILMLESALAQVAAPQAATLARSLGYAAADGWLKCVLPQVYPQIRLAIYAVLAFSLSVVDVALIVGPDNPPTLAVLALRGFSDADVQRWFPAAMAACLLLGLVMAAIGAWRAAERCVMRIGTRWIERGRRGDAATALTAAASAVVVTAFVVFVLSLVALVVWSFAGRWRFPAALPASWTFANWTTQIGSVRASALATLVVGAASTAIALGAVLGCLEYESRHGRHAARVLQRLIYWPLLVPQIAFLFGMQVLFVRGSIDGTWGAVIAMHVVFVLPYLFLALADPWRALDPRYARSAAALGASPARVFARIKLPLLARPILAAAAVGFSVSVGQYLPTLFAGAGRVATLTTDAVTLASGADRRVVGVYAVLQAALPLLAYLAAAALPARRHAGRHTVRRERS